MKNKKTLKVKLVKSLIGRKQRHIACARGLGLWRIGHEREVLHTPENLGMIKKIIYLLEVDKHELK